MSLPSSITSASHYAAGSGDPKQSRAQLKGLHDDLETINEHLKLSPLLSPAAPLALGEGLESASGTLRARLESNAGLARGAGGLSLDVGSLTAEANPVPADELAIQDVSAAARRKVTLAALFKALDGFDELEAPDGGADFLPIFDASAGAMKKVAPDSLGGGRWKALAGATASGDASVDFLAGFTSGLVQHLIIGQGVKPASDAARLHLRVKYGGAWRSTGGDYEWHCDSLQIGSGSTPVGSGSADNHVRIADRASGNAAGEEGVTLIRVFQPAGAGFTWFLADSLLMDAGGLPQYSRSTARFALAGAIEGLRVYFSSGNIAAGTFTQLALDTDLGS